MAFVAVSGGSLVLLCPEFFNLVIGFFLFAVVVAHWAILRLLTEFCVVCLF